MLPIKTAKNIKRFLTNNHIKSCTLMGGEFFTHPQWKKIFNIIIPNLIAVRLVTNGDWAVNDTIIKQLTYPNLTVSISNDKWHTNKYVDQAIQLCEKYQVAYNVATAEETTDASLVPAGNQIYGSYYSMFAAYCFNPQHHYNFLINEDGDIFKCGFGIWKYANIHDYLKGGFNARFKDFNLKFYNTFVPNCGACIRTYGRV
jgi:hypothetical protein